MLVLEATHGKACGPFHAPLTFLRPVNGLEAVIQDPEPNFAVGVLSRGPVDGMPAHNIARAIVVTDTGRHSGKFA